MEMMIACVLSFAVTGLLGWKVILPALRRLKAGQEIREVGPKWHLSKAGTPTMGGLMFIIGIALSILIVGWKGMLAGDLSHIYVFAFALVFGVIGFLDDYEKVKRHQNLGLTAIQKFLLQLAAAIAFLMLMRYEGLLSPSLYIPFFQTSIALSWPVYMIFAAFVIVGTVNAVNITDGLDGLSTSVTIPVALFFASVAAWWGYTQLGIFAGALLGGLLAFLLFNAHPAKVFMGDTGSLALGAAISVLAVATRLIYLLPVMGFMDILSTVSVILQVGSFKLRHKRIFKMAPLHHHFELKGMHETSIVVMYYAWTLAFTVLGLVSLGW